MARASSGPAKLTTPEAQPCPAEAALRQIAGKWKPRILRSAAVGPVRFNRLLRELPDSNRQALSNALRELEQDGVLVRTVVRLKPLHVEYHLTALGASLVSVLQALEATGTTR